MPTNLCADCACSDFSPYQADALSLGVEIVRDQQAASTSTVGASPQRKAPDQKNAFSPSYGGS
jgi:hypothetical protein